MHRSTKFMLVLSLVVASSVLGKNFITETVTLSAPTELDGVYEFVSETVVISKPEKVTGSRTQSDWGGIWFFNEGYFSRVMMKNNREDFFRSQRYENLGYESVAGTYAIEGKNIRLNHKYALHPFDVDSGTLLKYQIEGNTLTLTRTLSPSLEKPTEGIITMEFRRIK